MSFLDRVRDWLGIREPRRTGRKLPLGLGANSGSYYPGEPGDQSLGAGLIEGEAAEAAIHATDDPAEEQREEFGMEL
jgi:hypothetical protein